jgi:hypothetical protein
MTCMPHSPACSVTRYPGAVPGTWWALLAPPGDEDAETAGETVGVYLTCRIRRAEEERKPLSPSTTSRPA